MKKVQKIMMTVFNSPNANLTAHVEAQFQRKNQQGDLITNTYISSNGTAIMNPNMYLVFTYKSPSGDYRDDRSCYLSYPNLTDLRSAVETTQHYIENGFGDINGALVVKPEYSEKIFVTEIGKANRFIAFKLIVAETSENGVIQRMPAVQMELSDAEGFVSVLTLKDFAAIRNIVHDVNLATLQLQASFMFLSGEDQTSQGNYRPQNQGYNQGYQAAPQAPRYNNSQNYTRTSNYTPKPAAPAQPQVPTYNPMPFDEGVGSPMRPEEPNRPFARPAAPAQQMPPREEKKPIINMNAVEEVQVDDMSFDDTDAIAAIFKDED